MPAATPQIDAGLGCCFIAIAWVKHHSGKTMQPSGRCWTPGHVLQAFCRRHSVEVHQAVDAGCAGGESTRWLADSFPEARVTGVDISAHFLALAELRRR